MQCPSCGGDCKGGCERENILSDKETLAQWMIKKGYATGHGDSMEDLLKELEWQIQEKLDREKAKC